MHAARDLRHSWTFTENIGCKGLYQLMLTLKRLKENTSERFTFRVSLVSQCRLTVMASERVCFLRSWTVWTHRVHHVADLKQLEKEMRLCVSVHCCVSDLLSTAISRGQVQAIPRCASQGSCQRAAEEEEEPGTSQHQDTASYWGEDAMTDKQRTLVDVWSTSCHIYNEQGSKKAVFK